MPQAYINDPITPVGEPQQVNGAVSNTFSTTLDHTGDRWLDSSLRSHTHDAMELTMTRGSILPYLQLFWLMMFLLVQQLQLMLILH